MAFADSFPILQLAFDLRKEAKIKLEWLQESLVALPSNDSSIAGHVPTIMQGVVKNVDAFISSGATQQGFSSKDSVITTARLVLKLARKLC